MEEAGLFDIWKQRQWPIDLCKIEWEEKLSSARKLTLTDIRALIIILGAGLSAGTVALGIEALVIPVMINLRFIVRSKCYDCCNNPRKEAS